MGVRGLTTYVNDHEKVFLRNFFLHDCNLVVDGSNFSSQLYQRLNCFLAFGGDYDEIGLFVRNFFLNLRECNVCPYVIFDGSHETKKLETVYNRLGCHIKGFTSLDLLTRGSLEIIPLLLRDVFKEALTDVNVPYTVCEFEADDEIAAMARHLNCPVLSYDSDFFIYNVPYIPFNTMEIQPISLEENGNKTAMKCKIYKVDHVVRYFKGLQKESLPLLATLLGNDYVQREVFHRFFSTLIIPGGVGKSMQQRCIDGLFKWLQNETVNSAKAKILRMLRNVDQRKVVSVIEKSMESYKTESCKSLIYFNINNEQTTQLARNTNDEVGNDEAKKKKYTRENESSKEHELVLPTWIARRIRDGHIPKPYINLYTHHLYFSSPQAEDYSDDDSFLCTLPILRYAFDVINDFPNEYCKYIGREKAHGYKTFNVTCVVPRHLDISFKNLTGDQLRSCFNHFLQKKMKLLDLAVIDGLPTNFRLFMISVLWWVATCEVPLAHVHSLFICYVMLDVIDEKTGRPRCDQDLNKSQNSTKQQKCLNDNDHHLDKIKVQYEDCKTAARTLLKHFKVDEKIVKRQIRYDVKKMHSFAQFQCCLLQFNSLNTLCRCPFESTKYCRTYNGTFVYNIAVQLENQNDPCKFFDQYLKGSTSVLKFYKSLCKVYQKCANAMNLQTAKNNF